MTVVIGEEGDVLSERKWTIRNYRPEDADAVQELSARVFHERRPAQHFVWKFNANPAGLSISMVAEHSGRIVGQYAMLPTWLRIGGEVVFGVQACEAMTDPDFQKRGISTALAKGCMDVAVAKGVEVGYGLPNPLSYGALVRLNWEHTGDISRWVRVLKPAHLTMLPGPMRYVASLGQHLLPIGNDAPHGIEIRREKPTDQQLVHLAKHTTPDETDRTCRIERSVDWFKWKFDSRSQRRYVWFSAYRDGNLEAWAAFGINDWGELPLIDLMGSDPASLEAVVSGATRRAKELGLPALLAFTHDRNLVQALKSCGYFRYKSMPLVVRSFTSRVLDGNIRRHSSWRIASQDFDTF